MGARYRQFGMLLVLVTSEASGATLRITAPRDGVEVAPGKTVTVTVEADAGAYRQVAIIGEMPIGFGAMRSSPPYRFTVEIPADTTPKRYQLTAIGLLAPGKFDRSEPIWIHVEPAAAPVDCRVEPASAMELKPGEQLVLSVVGIFADGSESYLRESKWAGYQSDAPKVASVRTDGVVTGIAPGTAHIRICGSGSLPVIVRNR